MKDFSRIVLFIRILLGEKWRKNKNKSRLWRETGLVLATRIGTKQIHTSYPLNQSSCMMLIKCQIKGKEKWCQL